MPTRVAVTRAMPTPPTAAGSTFERELRTALWRRARAALALGIVISLVMNLLGRYVFRPPLPLESRFTDLVPDLYLGYVLTFVIGLALVWKDRWTVGPLSSIVIAVLGMTALLDATLTGVFYPSQDRFFGAALFLFIAAAMMPWRLAYQAVLGAIVVFVYPLAAWIAARVVPEVRTYWLTRTDNDIWHIMVDQTVAVAILALVSLYITRTLYTMRWELHAATRLGNYVIEGELGRGGMGRVYRARHAMIRRPTAVKVMDAEAAQSPEALARFEREVQLSATLTHPNTITIYDFGRTEDATFYYVMEYLDGVDLRRVVERFGPQPPERTAFILRQVCGSLAEAHARSIVHRDLKPSNIFLTQRGGLYDFVKVLDFGLAKQIHSPSDPQLTQAGSFFGTPLFMAPETAAEGSVGPAADQYSVGCVAYWLLTGKPPFEGTSAYDVIAKHLKVSPSPPSGASEFDISQPFDDIVIRCLAKSTHDRFGDMDELATALDSLRFEHAWDGDRAREWWRLHLAEPADEGAGAGS